MVLAKEAKLTHDTEFGGKMDPFIVFKINNIEKKTKVLDDAGKTPKWEQQFEFPNVKIGDIMNFIVYDEDTTGNDLVGQGAFSVSELYLNNKTLDWLSITYDKAKKPAGEVYFEIEYIPYEVKKEEEVKSEDPIAIARKKIIETQNEIKRLRDLIELEREKRIEIASPQVEIKKKEDPALNSALEQVKNEIESAKKFLDNFDNDMAETIAKYKIHLNEQTAMKKNLQDTNDALEILKTNNVSGKLDIVLTNGEFNGLLEFKLVIISSNQPPIIIKKTKDPVKGWIFNEKYSFACQGAHPNILFLCYSPDNKKQGLGGLSLYPVFHGVLKGDNSIDIFGKEDKIGRIDLNVSFKKD